MAEASHLAPLLAALNDLMAWLHANKLPGVIIGGVAASILGRPRATRDIDALVMVHESRWEALLCSGVRFGFAPRLPDCLEFAQRARVLLVRHGPTGIDVDLVLGALPFEQEVVNRGELHTVAGVEIRLPTPEDLIIMKAVARRPRDLADIESILDANPCVDCERILFWGEQFALALEIPGILTDLQTMLSRTREPEE